jgi:hypothetical protein
MFCCPSILVPFTLSGQYTHFTRIAAGNFELPINLIDPKIAKMDTTSRRGIPFQERLAATLRFFYAGDCNAFSKF